MKQGFRTKWSSPRCWAWWTVLPVFLVLAATAQAGDPADPGIGSDAVPSAVQGADLGPEAILGGAEPATPPAPGRGADSGVRPVGVPSPEPPPASIGGADTGADAAGRLKRSLEGSGAAANASDVRRTVTAQLTRTRRGDLKAVRATAFAAIDYVRAQVAGAIRRIDASLPSVGPGHKPPAETTPEGTAAPATGTNALAGDTRLAGAELSPPSGDARPATEASTDQLTAGADRPQGEHSGSSSVNPGPVSGLGSAAQILIQIGLAAAVCGLTAPAIRRRLDPRAGWLRSALLASSLEQPG
jgi:hypothetical protein